MKTGMTVVSFCVRLIGLNYCLDTNNHTAFSCSCLYLHAKYGLGGFNPEVFYEELLSAIDIFDEDRFISWKKRIELVEGNIEDSVPRFIEDNPGVRFSLVDFDCDL